MDCPLKFSGYAPKSIKIATADNNDDDDDDNNDNDNNDDRVGVLPLSHHREIHTVLQLTMFPLMS